MMPKMLISYSFLYYALYQYCSKVWGFSKDWPEAWAAIIISVVFNFLIGGVYFFSVALFDFDFLGDVANSKGLEWMPDMLRDIWHYTLILFINFYYFVFSNKWKDCVNKYSQFSDPVLRKNYFIVVLFLLFSVSLYISGAYYFEFNK